MHVAWSYMIMIGLYSNWIISPSKESQKTQQIPLQRGSNQKSLPPLFLHLQGSLPKNSPPEWPPSSDSSAAWWCIPYHRQSYSDRFHLSFSGSVGQMGIGHSGSEHRSSRDHVTLYNAIHTRYMRGTYCQLGHSMLLTTQFRNQENPLEWFYCIQT